VLLVAAIIVYPIAYTGWMSLQEWFASSLTRPRFIGLANYGKILLGDARFREAVARTIWFTVVAVAAETLLGVAMALLFNREFWGRGLLRTLAILPMVATPTAIALVFVMMYHPTLGVANYLVSVVGLSPFRWTYSSQTALYALALVDVWQWTPLIMLITLAGLASLPREPYEAAHLDGASPRQAFWHITLPLLRPALVVAILFRAIDALKTFDIIFVMTQGGPANATDHQSPALQPGVLLLQHGLRLVHGRRALCPRHGRLADPDQGAAEHDVVRGSARRRWLSTAGFYALAALFMLPTVFVFYWMLTLSLKPQIEATAYPPSFVRFSVTLAGYREVFTKYPFFLYTWNSLVVATGCTLLGLAVGLPAAYSIARWRQQQLAVIILVARIIPGIAYLIPWYIFFRSLRMVDTYGALILTHLIVGLPIIIWVMISFFEDVPADLADAALIDGCSHLGVFWRIALPLVKPGVVATGILSFVFSWNNFLFSVILAGRTTRTLPIAVYNMISYEEINWGTLAAAATLITLPVLLVALLAQRHIVTGLTFGAVKQ